MGLGKEGLEKEGLGEEVLDQYLAWYLLGKGFLSRHHLDGRVRHQAINPTHAKPPLLKSFDSSPGPRSPGAIETSLDGHSSAVVGHESNRGEAGKRQAMG